MEPLFPNESPTPRAPAPRWVRVVATLGPEGDVLATQLDVAAVDGTLLMSRGFWPITGRLPASDAIADSLRFAQELTMD